MKTFTTSLFILFALNLWAQEAVLEATHTSTTVQITWRWHPSTDATGYKWNTTNNYGTSEDMTTDTVKVETTLTANTLYTRYVWPYNTCGHSNTTTLTAMTLDDFVCGTSKTITHTAGAVAPVNKTVTYGTVDSIPGELSKCWTTSNLGATRQALAKNDTTEASAGWYWQFNRKQGFKHDGVSRTPSTGWASIDEYYDWLTANDPCAIEMGTGWRIPTSTEWTNVDAGGSWGTWTGPWDSDLKLHAAGNIYTNGTTMQNKGVKGSYWSSTQGLSTVGYNLSFTSGLCSVITTAKTMGYSVRCVKDSTGGNPPATTIPTVTTTAVSDINITTATSGGNVTATGGATIIAQGICWNTGGTPTLSDDFTTENVGENPFTSDLTELTASTFYYVRAYATNAEGTAYGNEVTFTSSPNCGGTIVVNHVAGTVSPVTKTVTYATVDSIPGELDRCWITSNLGATRQATAKNDATEASAGWYWQFNRKQGFKHTGLARTPSSTWVTPITANSDWLAANDPCTLELGGDWRIPTKTELLNIDAAGSWTSWDSTWNSSLKLHAAGRLTDASGSLSTRGTHGYYWSATQSSTVNGWRLHFYTGYCVMGGSTKANAFTLRCVK